MSELQADRAVKRRPEAQRSVSENFSKTQSTSSLPGTGLTDPTRNSQEFELAILQTPRECRIVGKAEIDKPAKASKWPLDPAPVVEFKLHNGDLSKSFLHSPFWFCSVALEPVSQPMATASTALTGCLVSSLHKVKLQDNIEHGLFIFGDLHAKITGKFRLRFTLYELRSNAESTFVAMLATKSSDAFAIHSGKSWPGQAESTPLSRHLCDSGVKLRIRKETSKRKAQSQDWSSDRRTAVSSFTLPMPMGPPPNIRRRLTGEDITPDQVRFAGGLGIRGAIDREQYTNTQGHPSVGNASLLEYRNSLLALERERHPSVSGSYSGQSNSASDNRSFGLYNPTPYASMQYTPGQADYVDPPGTITTKETKYGYEIDFIPTPLPPMPLQPYSVSSTTSAYTMGIGRYGASHDATTSSSGMDRYSVTNTSGGPSSSYSGRSAYTEPSTSYEDGRTRRSMLVAEPTETSNSLPAWNSTPLSVIEQPRSS